MEERSLGLERGYRNMLKWLHIVAAIYNALELRAIARTNPPLVVHQCEWKTQQRHAAETARSAEMEVDQTRFGNSTPKFLRLANVFFFFG